ncbi:hypothetical protein GCM10010308_50990 [Streptomyces vinaceusdrappus]|nr:hypothetical protein GCM10010301_53560 [Streptomyces plicatus]GHC27750.1 hypothetical protein GCM10010308_50990 [Streptomyces vinaceusdrappus]
MNYHRYRCSGLVEAWTQRLSRPNHVFLGFGDGTQEQPRQSGSASAAPKAILCRFQGLAHPWLCRSPLLVLGGVEAATHPQADEPVLRAPVRLAAPADSPGAGEPN